MQSNLTLPEKGKGKKCSSGVACKPPGVRPPSAYVVFPFLGRLLFFLCLWVSLPTVGWFLFYDGNGTTAWVLGDLGLELASGHWGTGKGKWKGGSSCTCIPTGISTGLFSRFALTGWHDERNVGRWWCSTRYKKTGKTGQKIEHHGFHARLLLHGVPLFDDG